MTNRQYSLHQRSNSTLTQYIPRTSTHVVEVVAAPLLFHPIGMDPSTGEYWIGICRSPCMIHETGTCQEGFQVFHDDKHVVPAQQDEVILIQEIVVKVAQNGPNSLPNPPLQALMRSLVGDFHSRRLMDRFGAGG
jgi:hypothetical protein